MEKRLTEIDEKFEKIDIDLTLTEGMALLCHLIDSDPINESDEETCKSACEKLFTSIETQLDKIVESTTDLVKLKGEENKKIEQNVVENEENKECLEKFMDLGPWNDAGLGD